MTKKIYIVQEDYTCTFYGVYADFKMAQDRAEEIGGFVSEFNYDLENNIIIDNQDSEC